ncbi:ribonuclease H-like domain-containing protein [Lachnospira multipara]|uniref:YprB ribonuclease H-like domain-containing protein n=1 Tax=Lachnospira multipara TaxID=28051 RepID=A0A1H5RJU9_9FIRM|nr:ribonuclease H-like domain-containing protein [Lachnospira multipara]SEF38635.1 hypothetical protein SAMN05216537_10152 [Lachnospira multipara]
MYTVNKQIVDTNLLKSIDNFLTIFNKSRTNTVFFDIETTGLSARNSMIYLLGYIKFNGKNWELNQLFCEKAEDEIALILTFNKVLSGVNVLNLVHYNGDSFDIPFLKKRAKFHELPIEKEFLQENSYESMDFFKIIRAYKNKLPLESHKQKDVEKYLGYERKDKFSGKELIKLFKDFIAFKEEEKRELILLHNHDDLMGMLHILPTTALSQLEFIANNKVYLENLLNSKINKEAKLDFLLEKKDLQSEINLSFKLLAPLAKDFNFNSDYFSLKITKENVSIKIKVIKTELKHFYKNYKDYFFIPNENKAIHKSVANYIDKEFRIKATKENCYICHTSRFIPVFEEFEEINIFKESFEKNDLFMELKDMETIKKAAYLSVLIKYAANSY